jgi:four helix bundle protein
MFRTSYSQTPAILKCTPIAIRLAGMSAARARNMVHLKRMHQRTYDLECQVIAEFRRIKPTDEAERVLWHELLRSQTSLATNSAESDGTRSAKDFIQKFQIALKEARESLQLLRLLKTVCPTRSTQLTALLKQCDELQPSSL